MFAGKQNFEHNFGSFGQKLGCVFRFWEVSSLSIKSWLCIVIVLFHVYSGVCSSEGLELRDGGSRNSRLLRTVCTRGVSTIPSTGSVVYARYFSNTQNPHMGFKVKASIGKALATSQLHHLYLAPFYVLVDRYLWRHLPPDEASYPEHSLAQLPIQLRGGDRLG